MKPWMDDRTAPNGHAVRDNFTLWFQGSRLLTAAGEPMVFFHGTAREGYNDGGVIDAFDVTKTGDRFRADEKGFFFTNDTALSDTYARADADHRDPGAGGGAVYPVFLRATRPLVVDGAFLAKEGMQAIGLQDDVVSFWDTYQSLVLDTWFNPRKHDAIVLVDASRRLGRELGTMVVVFDPLQIKSATGNSGLYARTSTSLHDQRVLLPSFLRIRTGPWPAQGGRRPH